MARLVLPTQREQHGAMFGTPRRTLVACDDDGFDGTLRQHGEEDSTMRVASGIVES